MCTRVCASLWASEEDMTNSSCNVDDEIRVGCNTGIKHACAFSVTVQHVGKPRHDPADGKLPANIGPGEPRVHVCVRACACVCMRACACVCVCVKGVCVCVCVCVDVWSTNLHALAQNEKEEQDQLGGSCVLSAVTVSTLKEI